MIYKKIKDFFQPYPLDKIFFFSFCVVHFFLFIFYRDIICRGQDLNLIHLNDLWAHPEWWLQGGHTPGMFKNTFFTSILFWLPVLIHKYFYIPLIFFFWLEFLIKAPILLYLTMKIINTVAPSRNGIAAAISIMTLSFWDFRILDINLNSFQSAVYLNYPSTTFLIFFLYGLLALYQQKWKTFAILLFLMPMIHPAQGVTAVALLLLLSIRHKLSKIHFLRISLFAALGFGIQKIILTHAFEKVTLVNPDIQWAAIGANGHLSFPILHQDIFLKFVIYLSFFYLASYLCSSLKELKKDLIISIIFLFMLFPIYGLAIYFKSSFGLQLGLLRASAYVSLIALINLGSFTFDEFKPKLKLIPNKSILLSLVLFPLFFSLSNIKISLALSVSFLIIVLYEFLSGKSLLKIYFIIILFLPLFVWPIIYIRKNKTELTKIIELQNYIQKNLKPGTMFLGWGNFNDSLFRTFTKAQLIQPQIFARIIYVGSKNLLEKELFLNKCVQGKEIDAIEMYTDLNYQKQKKKLDEPLNSAQLKCLYSRYSIDYIIYPNKIPFILKGTSRVYFNEEYSLYTVTNQANL